MGHDGRSGLRFPCLELLRRHSTRHSTADESAARLGWVLQTHDASWTSPCSSRVLQRLTQSVPGFHSAMVHNQLRRDDSYRETRDGCARFSGSTDRCGVPGTGRGSVVVDGLRRRKALPILLRRLQRRLPDALSSARNWGHAPRADKRSLGFRSPVRRPTWGRDGHPSIVPRQWRT